LAQASSHRFPMRCDGQVDSPSTSIMPQHWKIFHLFICSFVAIKALEQDVASGSGLAHEEGHVSTIEIGNKGAMHEVRHHSDAVESVEESGAETASRTMRRERSAESDAFTEELFEDAALEDATDAKKSGWWDRRRRVNCKWKGWGGWSGCSVTCGSGTKKMSRGQHGAKHGGRGCSGPSTKSAVCTLKVCPVDCRWSAWTGWSPCPVSCGLGKQVRKRNKLAHQAHGGKHCTDPKLGLLERGCALKPCPINCAWAGWGAWTACTASCGGGKQQRVRDRTHTAEHNGAQCPGAPTMTMACSTHPCPIDCEVKEWTEWGNCTEECGGGERGRVKSILIPVQHGGSPCPATEENGTCNEDACPIKSRSRPLSELSLAYVFLVLAAMLAGQ